MNKNKYTPLIKTLAQVKRSYYLIQIIYQLKKAHSQQDKSLAKKNLPILDSVENSDIQKIYLDFSEIVRYEPIYVFMFYEAIEFMKEYQFKKDPSVVVAATSDTMHLSNQYKNDWEELKKINLRDHTVRVVKNTIDNIKKSGRAVGSVLPILSAFFHDFGKSEHIRNDLLGNSNLVGVKYTPHSEVSKDWLLKVYRDRMFELFSDYPEDLKKIDNLIDKIAYIVEKHHMSISGKTKVENKSSVALVQAMDKLAREQEIKLLKK